VYFVDKIIENSGALLLSIRDILKLYYNKQNCTTTNKIVPQRRYYFEDEKFQITSCVTVANKYTFGYNIKYFVIVGIIVYTTNITTEYYCVVYNRKNYVITYVLV